MVNLEVTRGVHDDGRAGVDRQRARSFDVNVIEQLQSQTLDGVHVLRDLTVRQGLLLVLVSAEELVVGHVLRECGRNNRRRLPVGRVRRILLAGQIQPDAVAANVAVHRVEVPDQSDVLLHHHWVAVVRRRMVRDDLRPAAQIAEVLSRQIDRCSDKWCAKLERIQAVLGRAELKENRFSLLDGFHIRGGSIQFADEVDGDFRPRTSGEGFVRQIHAGLGRASKPIQLILDADHILGGGGGQRFLLSSTEQRPVRRQVQRFAAGHASDAAVIPARDEGDIRADDIGRLDG